MTQQPPSTTLIITTFNKPDYLKLTIESALSQSEGPREIIIADDGSGPSTQQCVQSMQAGAATPIIYVHQEDQGFRAARIRNKAIARATGDYIVLTDGDMILHRHFIHDHKQAARPGYFLQGGRVLLPARKSTQLLAGKEVGALFFLGGVGNRKNLIRSRLLSRLFSLRSRSLKGLRTCNFAFYKADALKVNGFNNAFVGWGREDSEFACRLINIGVQRLNLRFQAITYHLYHKEASRAVLEENTQRLKVCIAQRQVWCEDGIDHFLNAD